MFPNAQACRNTPCAFMKKLGLLPDVAKTRGGIRDYGERDLETLNIIECLKQTGMPLRDIMQFITWCTMGDQTIQNRHQMFLQRRDIVMKQLTQIKKTLEIIDFKIKYYADAMAAGTLGIYQDAPRHAPCLFN